MAALTITAASVVKGANARIDRNGYAAATITAGQAVYKAADGRWNLADDDAATAIIRVPIGIALGGSSANQPIAVQTDGDITIGATMTAGLAYYLGATPGAIVPVGDVITPQYPAVIGIARSTTVLRLVMKDSGVAL
jgi:hypothetical protein